MSRHRAVRNLDLDGVHTDFKRSYSKLNMLRSHADELDDSPLDEGLDADYRETQTVETCAIQNAHKILHLLLPCVFVFPAGITPEQQGEFSLPDASLQKIRKGLTFATQNKWQLAS